jgi:hypothetical protein
MGREGVPAHLTVGRSADATGNIPLIRHICKKTDLNRRSIRLRIPREFPMLYAHNREIFMNVPYGPDGLLQQNARFFEAADASDLTVSARAGGPVLREPDRDA